MKIFPHNPSQKLGASQYIQSLERIIMISSKSVIQYGLLFAIGISLILSGGKSFASAQSSSQYESHVLVGDDLKNNPLAQKILSEIEESKKRIEQIQKEQRDRDINAVQIEQKRELAGQLQQEAIASMDTQNESYTSKAAFESFVSTINNTASQNIFWGEYNFMSQRIDAGKSAMKQILEQGGSWDDAIQAFSRSAAIHRQEMIQENTMLNIEYGVADPSVQSNFDANGLLPADYIKTPDKYLAH
jgi:hypothetical protein